MKFTTLLNFKFLDESVHFFVIENVENSNIERRIMPSRTSKTKSRNESVPAVSTSKDFDDDLEDIVSDEDREQSELAGPLGKRTERNCVKVF